ncbi:MAG TPA: TIR domain-containing protein [Candidatus Bathyarchaeia archaeon]|nr:TIR domain-containing protein [Candidatus Bathyarchaeia archaeon]
MPKPRTLRLITVQTIKYHIYIEYSEPDKSGFRFNVSHAELIGKFQEPFANGEPFWFMGRLLNPIKVAKIVIFWSYQTADQLHLPNHESLIAAKDKKYLIDNVLKGQVKGVYLCTEEFVVTQKKSAQAKQAQPDFLTPSGTPRRIIVVSGTDEIMKQTITGALRKLGLAAIVMNEEPSQGKKIVDRFADYADVGFALVLLSPDVYVYPKGEEATKRERIPKQDVTLMFGFLLGKLGKDNVLAFYRESPNFAFPIEFEGVKFTALDDRDSWKLALIRELTNCGYTVDAERLLR